MQTKQDETQPAQPREENDKMNRMFKRIMAFGMAVSPVHGGQSL